MLSIFNNTLPPETTDFVTKMAQAIRRVSEPDLIVLFGSHARGSATSQSDVDLMVVQDRSVWQAPSRMDEVMRLRSAMPSGVTPVDLLLITPTELDRWKSADNHVISDAIRNGVLVYERN